MNVNTNFNAVNENCSNVNYPTARVVTGILGFLALCTIATNYAVNAVFDMNVFLSVIATSLVTCFAACNTEMWKNGFQVFSGKVENIVEACCFWNVAARGFLYACAIFSVGAFFSATNTATFITALAPVFFPFFMSICGYYVCKTISNACAYCVINTQSVNALNWQENVYSDTNVTIDSNATKVTSGVTVNS
ncbi:MAG: hypothetical protein AAEJ04_11800 [Planctomycetota bacterium]